MCKKYDPWIVGAIRHTRLCIFAEARMIWLSESERCAFSIFRGQLDEVLVDAEQGTADAPARLDVILQGWSLLGFYGNDDLCELLRRQREALINKGIIHE
ncbi:hypothetical protein [Burkholderia gladioli]|uniref:hypothetical protein n=1 Tax=Burkholderia gladioli TaxID=28095 RepID=UPI000D00EC22|nr:hypothetical protein [Burkholderia gladioli]MBU9170328.1 hypothetical protein [Burkholderia gladioli]MBU9180070.1 hypothetical protein [Burkholderia gladioli]MBU9218487.1 hypothetical protein [Burkholderia gladioli]MBU9385352.1 hypothetical protein [Burkholderia gladioli]MDN7728167.1 hypothetical protein [Burkholderia gladioli]